MEDTISGRSHQDRRAISERRVIEAAKSKISTLQLAEHLQGHGVTPGRATRCPMADHEDRHPSFFVYQDTDSWYCYGCLRGGDVIELARHAWGYEKHEAKMAAADLLWEFGHEIPSKPPSWFRKQERQRDTRAAIEQTRKNIVRRRIFKYCILPILEHIEDEQERAKETLRAFADLKDLLP